MTHNHPNNWCCCEYSYAIESFIGPHCSECPRHKQGCEFPECPHATEGES